MIQNVLPIIGSQLNEYLKSSFGEVDDRVIVTSIGNSSGASTIDSEYINQCRGRKTHQKHWV